MRVSCDAEDEVAVKRRGIFEPALGRYVADTSALSPLSGAKQTIDRTEYEEKRKLIRAPELLRKP